MIDWRNVQFNANTQQVKQMERQERNSRRVTDKDCFDACMENLGHPIMLEIKKMIEGFIADDDGTPFSVGRAVSVLQVRDWFSVHNKQFNWSHIGDALVGRCLKEEYPSAKMKLNLCPKGYKMLLDAYPDSFIGWREDIQKIGQQKRKQREHDNP